MCIRDSLTVCAALTAHGCNCTVLEAADRVGGRMRTLDGAFDGLDAGAHWVHGGRDASQPVRRWLDARAIETARSPYYDGAAVSGATGERLDGAAGAAARALDAWDAAAGRWCLARAADDDASVADALGAAAAEPAVCLLYTSPSPRDRTRSRMPSSA